MDKARIPDMIRMAGDAISSLDRAHITDSQIRTIYVLRLAVSAVLIRAVNVLAETFALAVDLRLQQ
jgi:hypothetical protein